MMAQERFAQLLVVHAVHVLDELQNLVGVADLVVVPADHLHEGVGQGNAGLSVKDGAKPKKISTFSIFNKSYYIS